MAQVENLSLENVRLIFKNFSGAQSEYNRKGDRNFCVVLEDPELIETMINDGWNVKTRPPRDEDGDPLYYVRIKIGYFDDPEDRRNPRVMVISGNNRRYLSQEDLSCLDYMSIKKVDVSIRPYQYDVNGKTGISGYLKALYVTQKLDPLEEKYATPDEDDDNPFG